MTTSTTTTTRTRSNKNTKPAAAETAKTESAETAQGVKETASVPAQAMRDRQRVLRGYAYRLSANDFFPARDEEGKKAVFYFRFKTRLLGETADVILDVRAFGPQAEFLNRNLVHNTAYIIHGLVREVEAKDRDGNAIMKQVIFPSEPYGVTLQLPTV